MTDSTFEERLGLTSLPINGKGLCMAVGFWLLMFKACQLVSSSLARKTYSTLSPAMKNDWDNFAWSMTHGVLGFLVRFCLPACLP